MMLFRYLIVFACVHFTLSSGLPWVELSGSAASGEAFGSSVANVGDFNGDGIDDILMGAPSVSIGGKSTRGASYLLYGRRNLADLTIPTMTNRTRGVRIFGAFAGESSGSSVSGLGDINGDGFDDIIIGASAATYLSRTNCGAAYVIFGRAAPFTADIDLSALPLSTGFAIYGAAANDRAGVYVGTAGDVNNDGLSDILVTAPSASPLGRSGAGTVYLIFGRRSYSSSVINLATLTSSIGVRFDGAAVGDNLGSGTTSHSVGDFNRDGIPDFVISAPGRSANNLAASGAVYVVFGKVSGWGNMDMTQLVGSSGIQGIQFWGETAGALMGRSARLLGDINNDGYPDLAFSSHMLSPLGRLNAGQVMVFYGSQFSSSSPIYNMVTFTPSASSGYKIFGERANDQLGWTIDPIGDFNGDGIADFVVGSPFVDGINGMKAYAGCLYVIWGRAGSAAPTSNIDLLSLTSSTGFKISGAASDDMLGWTVSGAGDVDGDGFPDILIGAKSIAPSIGKVYVIFGQGSGTWSDIDLSLPTRISFFTTMPTRLPSVAPSRPTFRPTLVPSTAPTVVPSVPPTALPTTFSTQIPTASPTAPRTALRSGFPTAIPTFDPTNTPTLVPTAGPSITPSLSPTDIPSSPPTLTPSAAPSSVPSQYPTALPSVMPTMLPTALPSVLPTFIPTDLPSALPSTLPSVVPTQGPTVSPSLFPSEQPTEVPSQVPSLSPSMLPTASPSESPSVLPTTVPSCTPSVFPSYVPSVLPTAVPSQLPSFSPSETPTDEPTESPTDMPSDFPTFSPSVFPSAEPSIQPSWQSSLCPSVNPSVFPSMYPSILPSFRPTACPSASPSVIPTIEPSAAPTRSPSAQPTVTPTRTPSFRPALNPSQTPSALPTSRFPTAAPSVPGLASYRLLGKEMTDYAGSSVSFVGDVNGDGFDDVMVSLNNFGQGISYVLYGPQATNNFDVSTLTPGVRGFRIFGANAPSGSLNRLENSGSSLSGAGDINNDGYDDILIGAMAAQSFGRTNAGAVYVIFGGPTRTTDVSLTSLSAATGFRIFGAAANDNVGLAGSIASVGDINGDGFNDIIIGAPGNDPLGRSNAGSAYVLYGKASGFVDVDLGALTLSQGFRIAGAVAGDNLGRAVSSAGDFNGDGFDDIILGASNATRSGLVSSGLCYVIFGGSGKYIDIDLIMFSAGRQNGFRLVGAAAGDFTGYSVSSAGDVNGDGFADVLVGAYGTGPAGRNMAGSAYVVFGRSPFSTPFVDINLATLAKPQGVRIFGSAPGDQFGFSVSTVGDLDKDGLADLLVGSPGYFGATSNAGMVTVIYGKALVATSVTTSFDTSLMSGTSTGFRLRGFWSGIRAGASVSGGGDFNGDGFPDFIFGAPNSNVGNNILAGAAHLYMGGRPAVALADL